MSLMQLVNLSLDGIIGFSAVPLNLIGVIGIFISMGALLFSLITLILNLVFNTKVGSWTWSNINIFFKWNSATLDKHNRTICIKNFHETKKDQAI